MSEFIFSPRRYGKILLIRQVLDLAKSDGLLTFYVDLYPAINKQRKLMVTLAKEHSPEVFSKNFLAKYSLGASSSIQKAIKKLLEKDLILQANGSYVIYDLFMPGG